MKKVVRRKKQSGWLVIIPAIFFAAIPLATLAISSFRVTESSGEGSRTYWSTEGWNYAFSETYSLPSGWDAMYNSIGYALICLVIALPLGWILAQTINDLEKITTNGKSSRCIYHAPFRCFKRNDWIGSDAGYDQN